MTDIKNILDTIDRISARLDGIQEILDKREKRLNAREHELKLLIQLHKDLIEKEKKL